MTNIDETKWRDSGFICPLHGNIEDKLDQIIERQISQIQDITHIKYVVENGLKTSVLETVETLKIITKRIEIIEKFSWFVEWMTQMRDNLFKNTLKIALIGGGICVIIYFGNDLVNKIISKMIG